MRLSLSPVTVEHEGTLAIGDRLTVNGTAKVTNVSVSQSLDMNGETVEEAFASLVFEENNPSLAAA